MRALSQHPSTNACSTSQHHLVAQLVVQQLQSFVSTPLDYEPGAGAESPFYESAQHAINLRLHVLQIRLVSSFIFRYWAPIIKTLGLHVDKFGLFFHFPLTEGFFRDFLF